jgi:hypothetical protein
MEGKNEFIPQISDDGSLGQPGRTPARVCPPLPNLLELERKASDEEISKTTSQR